MTSPRRFLAAAFVLGIAGCAVVHLPPSPPSTRWAHETSDLKPDPEVTWGRLENGLRYAILPHAVPPDRVSLFLLVQTGSYYEKPSERGYAHFVEHMAYRELRGVPDGAMAAVDKLGADRTGISMGTTSPFETEYRIDNLPAGRPETFAAGLGVLRAIADGMIFAPASIAHERGVILNEGLTRDAMMAKGRPDELEYLPPDSAGVRGTELEAAFGNTRITQRFPIGVGETLQRANPARLRAFYERWYRPERMILTVVGDVKPAEAAAFIARSFSSLAPKGSAPTPPAVEWPKTGGPLRIHVDIWNAEPHTRLGWCALAPVAGIDSIARRRESLVRRLALAMLDARFEREARSEDPILVSTESVLSHAVPGLELALVRAEVAPPLWLKGMTTLDSEMRRAREQGFAATELERVVKSETIRVNAAARQAAQRPGPELAQTLAFAIARGVVFTSAADDRDLTAAQLATITEAQCQAALRTMLAPENLSLAVAGPFPAGPPASDAMTKPLEASRAQPLVAYSPPPPLRPFPYTDFGPAGEIVRRAHVDDCDADLLEFANGVRVNLKRTTFEPGRVHLLMRLDAGRIAAPPDKPGLAIKMLGWPLGGLSGLTSEELAATLTDLTGNPSVSADATDFRLSEIDDATHLPLLLQLVAALFTHPGFHEEKRALEFARQSIASYSVTASGAAQLAFQERLSGNHPAMRIATAEEIARLTNDELKAWLLPQLASAPMEVSLVGDFDPATAVESLARTLGALPRRGTADPFAEQRRISFPPAPFTETVTFDGNPGVAAAIVGWPVPEAKSYSARFRARLLAAILEQRLWQKLRVEQGETYVLSASFDADDSFDPAMSCLHCVVETAPDRIEPVAATARDVAATLARDGATADELERARGPLLHNVESGLRDNDWLLDLVAVAQSDPAYATGWAHAAEDYRAATLAEINALARQVLPAERACRIIARPK